MEVEQRMREGGGKDDRVRHWGLKRDGPKCEFGPMMKGRSEEHTSELQSQSNLVCRLLLEKKKKSLSTFILPATFLPPFVASMLFLLICFTLFRPSVWRTAVARTVSVDSSLTSSYSSFLSA